MCVILFTFISRAHWFLYDLLINVSWFYAIVLEAKLITQNADFTMLRYNQQAICRYIVFFVFLVPLGDFFYLLQIAFFFSFAVEKPCLFCEMIFNCEQNENSYVFVWHHKFVLQPEKKGFPLQFIVLTKYFLKLEKWHTRNYNLWFS